MFVFAFSFGLFAFPFYCFTLCFCSLIHYGIPVVATLPFVRLPSALIGLFVCLHSALIGLFVCLHSALIGQFVCLLSALIGLFVCLPTLCATVYTSVYSRLLQYSYSNLLIKIAIRLIYRARLILCL